MARRVAIVGTGQTKHASRRKDCSTPDMVYEVASKALEDAELKLKDIDAVVFASAPEALHGVNSPDKWCSGAAGGFNKPFMRINTGGATGGSAAIAGIHHIASGLFDTVLVVGMDKLAETPDTQRVLNRIYDPVVAMDFALNIIAAIAIETSLQMGTYGFTEEHIARISVKNHLNALNNPYAHLRFETNMEKALKSPMVCWPIKLIDCCPRSEGACAIVIASEEKAKRITPIPAWVKATAAVTDITVPGEAKWQSSIAVNKAYKIAGISDPRHQIQVAEPYIPFSPMEVVSYADLGFCKEKEVAKLVEAGFGEMGGEVPFSPSGGVLCSNPIGATALVRVAEGAIQVMNKGEKRQVPDVKNALVTGAGGSPGPGSGSFITAMILGREP